MDNYLDRVDEVDEKDNYINVVHNKSGINFNVFGEFSIWWFTTWLNDWELNTFHILNYYAPKYGREEIVNADDIKRNIYIDIGSWIGPTVLYAANFYNKVIAIEPDPVALERLRANINVNRYNNIVLVDKALGNLNGTIKFGGNGNLGNSESTMLVSDNDYIRECWGGRWNLEERGQNIIDVSCITIENLIKTNNIDADRIALIKMDIEGGELYLIPALMPFLYEYDIPLYISLHYVFLKISHIKFILNILFNYYKNCYLFDENGTKILVSKNRILNEKITTLVFENINKFENKSNTFSVSKIFRSNYYCSGCNII